MYSQKRLERLLCLDDFEVAAQRFLPKAIFGYVSGATETNSSFRDNREVFAELGFIPRVLCDVSKVNTDVTLWGDTYASPFGIAPMGISAMSAYRGDCVLAQSALSRNLPMIMSGSSLTPLEEVAKIGKNVWFQAYLPGSEEQIVALIRRVAAAGYEKLVVTVDTPVAANRENNVRAGFSTPLRPTLKLLLDGVRHPGWTTGTFLRTLYRSGIPHFENSYATRGVPIISRNVLRDFSDRGHLNWAHLKLIRSLWPGKLIVKGIIATEDAKLAVGCGADAIIVSNHGGRQLDGTVSPLRVLPEIVAACPSVPIMMDSGIRRGTDVLKAMALGAKFVFVGRPFGYAAAIGGEKGVHHAMDLLSAEVRRNTAMLGVTDVTAVGRRSLRALSTSSVFARHLDAI
ncbi:alpha-hydroxy-acid oxidizing enzyme [Pollutimonas nitritireducens]|uniref:Alpha-hydroxy-acid oxidizing enzyme n=1 Tax=Pollutimonas nitritireducens TaxID=2045209 RepID=A0A2N4UEE4_9BURK|nr:alpha-hydroxy acid oxidase [Pollutimonas nitritireducens]PLC53377.1 alpha-hydroxy-acid oxidizing enzyme [Pollutimonas nitritireducens]